jgi:hypothetical protein
VLNPIDDLARHRYQLHLDADWPQINLHSCPYHTTITGASMADQQQSSRVLRRRGPKGKVSKGKVRNGQSVSAACLVFSGLCALAVAALEQLP